MNGNLITADGDGNGRVNAIHYSFYLPLLARDYQTYASNPNPGTNDAQHRVVVPI